MGWKYVDFLILVSSPFTRRNEYVFFFSVKDRNKLFLLLNYEFRPWTGWALLSLSGRKLEYFIDES